MKIRIKSLITGEYNVLDLDVEAEGLLRWKRGELVQNVFPHLTADEREFLITGLLPPHIEEVFHA